MVAPKKVTAMADLANRLIAERSTPTTSTEGPTAPIEQPPKLSVVNDAPVAKEEPQGVNEYAIDPALLTPTQAPKNVVAPQPSDWEHKYNVLKGMMDRTNADNTDRIGQLENQISILSSMARPTSPQETFHPTAAPQASDYGMSEEEIEALGGQDFVDSLIKISAAGSAVEISELRDEIHSLRDSQTESKEDIFYNQLSSLCPQWRVINKDDGFKAWLLGDEGLSGIEKKSFLENAYENKDAATSARYFNEYLRLQPGSPGLNPDVISDIIPNASGGGAPPSVPSGNIYTRQTILKFFKDRGLGRFKGKEEEAEAIERDIFAAQREGRIIKALPEPM